MKKNKKKIEKLSWFSVNAKQLNSADKFSMNCFWMQLVWLDILVHMLIVHIDFVILEVLKENCLYRI